MTENNSSKKTFSKMNLKSLRLSLKYRPKLLKLVLKMRQCIRKRNYLVKSLKHRIKQLETANIENKTKVDFSTQTYNDEDQRQDSKPDVNTETCKPNETKERGWDLTENGEAEKSIAQQVKEAAQSVLQDSGMVYVESAGMYYDYKTGYYYNSELGLYYHTETGCYYYYSEDKQFVFHSYPDMSKVNASLIAHQQKKARKLKRERKPEDGIDNLTNQLSQDKEEDGSNPKRSRKSKSKKEKRKDKTKRETKKKSEDKMIVIEDSSKNPKDEDVPMEEKNTPVEDKDALIEDNLIKDKDAPIEKKDASIEEKDASIEKKDASIEEKDASIEEKDAPVEENPVPVNETNLDKLPKVVDASNENKEGHDQVPVKIDDDNAMEISDSKDATESNTDTTGANDTDDIEMIEKPNNIEAKFEVDQEIKNNNEIKEVEDVTKINIELEDGECSDTSSEESESDSESDASTSTVSDEDSVAKHHPPCMRVIVRETKLPKLKVGSLFLVTKDGGTVGREGDKHVILLKDHNVSRNHLDIRYDMARKTYQATDLGSKNGSILNGVRMSESQEVSLPLDILHGSIIQLGETKLLCHIHPGHATCGQCEPGLLMQVEEEKKVAYTRTVNVKKQHELELARLKNIYAPQRLAIEEKPYNDRAQARREAVGSTNHAEKTQASDLDTSIAPDNKGFKLLQKMGWSKGEGLGKESQGDTEPVPLISNEGKAGLGTTGAVAPPSNTPRPRVIKNNIAAGTMRLAARTNMLKPPAKAFQNEGDEESE